MTVDELVAKLQEYPGYWPVAVQVTVHDMSELTGEEWDRVHRADTTDVSAVADGHPPGSFSPVVVLS